MTMSKLYPINYWAYITEKQVEKPEEELKYLIALICIENKIFTNNENNFHSFYSNAPKELYTIYKVEKNTYPKKAENETLKNKKEQLNKFAIYKKIYENQAFIDEKAKRNAESTNADILKELINENKINIKNIVQ